MRILWCFRTCFKLKNILKSGNYENDVPEWVFLECMPTSVSAMFMENLIEKNKKVNETAVCMVIILIWLFFE